MIIVNCDKCGKQANRMFCNPEGGESENRVPCKIKLIEGFDETNCKDIRPEQDKSWDLCRSCFEPIKLDVCEFIAEGETND